MSSKLDPKTRTKSKPGPWPPVPEATPVPPPPPSTWAKRTGFRPKFSGETNASDSGHISFSPKPTPDPQPDLESGRARPAQVQKQPPPAAPAAQAQAQLPPPPPQPVPPVTGNRAVNGMGSRNGNAGGGSVKNGEELKRRRDSDGGGEREKKKEEVSGRGGTEGVRRGAGRSNEEVIDVIPQNLEGGGDDDGFVVGRHSHMKYELRDSPGLGQFMVSFYSF